MKFKKTKSMPLFRTLILAVLLFVVTFESTAMGMNVIEVETQVVYPTTGTSENKYPENNGKESFTTEQFRVDVEYGLNGIIKYGTSMPISVKVTNLGKDFEGTLRIVAGSYSSSEASIAYDHDLIIAEGAFKTFEITSQCSTYGRKRIGVEILNLKEKSIFAKNIEIDNNYSDHALIGILSDDFTALNYFDGTNIESPYGGTIYTSVVELKKDDIPTSAEALSCLNFLVINSFDTSQLSEEQYKVIQDWVNEGGILIIGTGPDASKTLSMFDDNFLQGTINGVVTGQIEIIPAQKKGIDGVITFKEGHGVQSITIEGGEILNNTNNIFYDESLSVIQKKEIGKGAVLVAGFNLGLEPIDSLNWNDYLGTALLNDSLTNFTTDLLMGIKDFDSYANHRMYDLLSRLFNVDIPNIGVYALFFVLYVLIAGPVGYLILKSFDKREWIWGLIPTCAVLFTLFLSILSIPSRITGPMVSNFTVLQLQDNVVSQRTFMALQTPDTKEHMVQLRPEYRNFSPLKMESSGMGGNRNDNTLRWDYRVKNTTEGYQIITNHSTTFTTDYMKFEEVLSGEDCSMDIQLTEATTAYISGSVTNNTGYDMIETFIGYGSIAVYLGKLANGETKTFTAQDNMYMPSFSSWSLSDYFESKPQVKAKVETAYGYITDSNGDVLDYNQGIVLGYVENLKQDLVTSSSIEESGAGLIYKQFTQNPQDVNGRYISNLFSFVINPNYDDMDFTNHMMYRESVEVEFNVPITKIEKIIKTAPPYNGWYEDVAVWGYNYETGIYDEWFVDFSDEMTFEHCPYVNEKGYIKLRFECNHTYEEMAPGIALIGE